MRIGDAGEFKRLAEGNLELFKRLKEERGVRTIVTSCAGCYRAIKKDYSLSSEYKDIMDGIEVIHTVELLYRQLKEGNLEFKDSLDWRVTYHDPCHTGRHLTKFIIDEEGKELWKGAYVGLDESECLYDIPRELIKAIPGISLLEMERIRANSYCCGGGGGVMTGFGEWAARNAGIRIQEGMETGADYMVSICPFCHYNLNEGAKGIKSPMKVLDLVQLLDQVTG
jgi:Fe-S oxidoreductase